MSIERNNGIWAANNNLGDGIHNLSEYEYDNLNTNWPLWRQQPSKKTQQQRWLSNRAQVQLGWEQYAVK